MPRVVWAEKFETGHGFETRQRQRKYQREPKVQSLANPAVFFLKTCLQFHVSFPKVILE